MSRSLVAPFLLATAGVLGGCSTLEGAKKDIGDLYDKGKAAVTDASAPRISNAPAAAAAAPQAPAEAVAEKPKSGLNPTLKIVLDAEAAKKGKQINFEGACAQQIAAANAGRTGPTPIDNPHAVNSVQNQAYGAARGVLNSATGGNSLFSRSLNTLGNTGIAVSQAVGQQWSVVCNRVAQASVQGDKADLSPMNSPDYTARWNTIASQAPSIVTLALNTEKGAAAMQGRGTNSVITDAASTGLNKIYKPQQGVLPDFLNRILK